MLGAFDPVVWPITRRTLTGMGSLQTLTYDECLRRLDAAAIGRVAITEHAMPAIVPVNFVRSGHRILFRTEPDGMLAHGCDRTVVAFEIDGVDPSGRAGWSVLVVGRAELVGDDQADVASAVRGRDGQLIAVGLTQVSGREVVPSPHAA